MTAIGMGLRAGSASVGAATTSSATAKFAGRLLVYIPADVVAGYTSAFALVNTTDASYGQEWLVAWIFFGLAPVLVAAFFVGKYRSENNNALPSFGSYPWYRIVVAPLAFAAWVTALPDSPVVEWFDPTEVGRCLAIAVTAIVLSAVGHWFDPTDPTAD